jgi:GNAT superfamily N-acetyltransferase
MIRVATPSDSLEKLTNDAGIPGLTPDRVAELVAAAVPAGECLVHVDSVGDVDGFVVTNKRSFFDRDFVRLVSVDSSRRRSGIARALLTAVVARATSETVFISTNVSNSAMRELLSMDRWIPSGTLSGLDEGDPEVVFWKSKTPPPHDRRPER